MALEISDLQAGLPALQQIVAVQSCRTLFLPPTFALDTDHLPHPLLPGLLPPAFQWLTPPMTLIHTLESCAALLVTEIGPMYIAPRWDQAKAQQTLGAGSRETAVFLARNWQHIEALVSCASTASWNTSRAYQRLYENQPCRIKRQLPLIASNSFSPRVRPASLSRRLAVSSGTVSDDFELELGEALVAGTEHKKD